MMESHDIIESVKKYPVLYDPKYEKQTERKQAWIEVGNEINQDVEIVKRKWKNIKDEYVKFLNGLSKSRNYGLASTLTFLDPYLRGLPPTGKKSNNTKHEESDVENDLPNRSPASLKSSPDTMNGLDLIFLGVSNLMKTYPLDPPEPSETLSSLDEVDQTCSQITNIINTYAQSEPDLVNRKINDFFKAQCVDNDNQNTSDSSDGTNKLIIKFNFKRRQSKVKAELL